MIFKPNLCKKEKGNEKNFNLKKKSNFFLSKFFWIFLKKFFALNQPKVRFKANKIFKKFQKKKFMIQIFTFFKLKFFFISLFFFEKVRHVFIFCVFWLSKISHFNMSHPVYALIQKFKNYPQKIGWQTVGHLKDF